MAGEQERVVLIHPTDSPEFPQESVRAQGIWQAWGWPGDSGIEMVRALSDTRYVDGLPDGTRLLVGGQVTSVCVRVHLEFVAEHPRVRSGAIEIGLVREALVGDEQAVDELVAGLVKQGVRVVIVD